MSTFKSIEALRKAKPGGDEGLAAAVDEVWALVEAAVSVEGPVPVRRAARGRRVGVGMAGASLVAAAAIAVLLTLGSPGGGPGVESATAAIAKAATLTAASAERSGTAVVRMTKGGEPWAGKTVRWSGADLDVTRDIGGRPGSPSTELRLAGGTMYGVDPADGGWVVLGDPSSIDPGSGTTPAEYLAGVREDVGGPTLRRITVGMTGLTTRVLPDGSTVYRGKVAAGLIARETGFKEGQAIRVLPFGYVAHDEAADPAASLSAEVTVGPDGIVRELAVSWGSGASTWTYAVGYSALGATPPPAAPARARPLRERMPA
jgi:hypothetical protein